MLEPLIYTLAGFALASVFWFLYFKTKSSNLIDRSALEEKNLLNKEVALQNISEISLTHKKMEWLGLFKNDKLTLGEVSAFDMFASFFKAEMSSNLFICPPS